MTPNNQKNKKDMVKILEERWPKLFNFNFPKPLMVGIIIDIFSITDEAEHVQIKKSVTAYVRRLKYARCLAKGGPRYNLDGEISGEVSKEAQLVAINDIKKNKEKVKNKAKNIALDKKNKEEAALRKAAEKESLSFTKTTSIKVKKENTLSEDKALIQPLSLKLGSSKKAQPKIVVKKKRSFMIPQ
jgi:sRNA-binding protein